MCVCPQGYEVRKITAMDQDLGRPRGIGYTIVSGLSPIINLTFTAQREKLIMSYHNPTGIIDKYHRAEQSITLENRVARDSPVGSFCHSQFRFVSLTNLPSEQKMFHDLSFIITFCYFRYTISRVNEIAPLVCYFSSDLIL